MRTNSSGLKGVLAASRHCAQVLTTAFYIDSALSMFLFCSHEVTPPSQAVSRPLERISRERRLLLGLRCDWIPDDADLLPG